jgi:serine protease AprX
MSKKVTGLLILLLVALLIAVGFANRPTTALADAWQSKVDPWVLETAAEQGETEFLVFLAEQADVSGAAALHTKLEKGQYVYERLTEVANQTQLPVRAALDSLGVEYRPYWVANMIWVRGDQAVVQAMAERPDVAHVYANPRVHISEVYPAEEIPSDNPEGVEWNILKVNADDVWAMGYTGQGAVIAGQDTGYDWDHPALQNQYRGWNGSVADHNYSWHDAIHQNDPHTSPGNPCGFDIDAPCDDQGHGTHTMGTMVGDDGGSNQIGMAPGARWIGCRNMEEGWGMPSTYSECYQWFIAPTDLNDQNPDPAMAPDVISNSWGCPVDEGCTDPNVMLTVVENVRAAGILTNHSAGNSGSGCSTVNTPAGIYDASFTVGATDSSDNIAGFSSRGPVTLDGSNRLKPDISAPGVGVRSSVPGTGYSSLSGTSMASPHIAGLVGLLISADPSLAGNVDMLENVITTTAVPRTTTQVCGGVPGDQIPNNTYGYGRIDALAAVQSLVSALTIGKSASADYVAPGEVLTYTLTVGSINENTNVVVTDTIPDNTTFVSASGTYTLSGSTVTWDIGDLGAGGTSVELVVQVDEDASGTIVNENYGVDSDEIEPVSGNPVSTPIYEYALGLSKVASAIEVEAGDLLTYTITVTNLHPLGGMTGVQLSDMIPSGTTFVTATLPHTFDGTTVTWMAGALPGGSNWTVTLVVQVSSSAVGSVTNDMYSVVSDQAAAADGPPVTTVVIAAGTRRIYLPIVIHN